MGTGRRVALSALAIDFLTRNKRPLRVAIDTPIWLFQCQSGQGGQNPVLRTLYYRLLRILALPIHPLFVFDGKEKPALKRNKKSRLSREGYRITKQAKTLLSLFGFPWHDAPGEAEAECAHLQLSKVVDAVMSDDADTLMFGSTRTIMDWSREGSRGNKTPSHVNYFDCENKSEHNANGLALDRAGMILFAMCNGGDYLPGGLVGCGPGLSMEISKAGFGQRLLDAVGKESAIAAWRTELQQELQTNESGFFKTKHKKLQIPETFPDPTVLSYYTDPAVSSAAQLEALETKLDWSQEPDLEELVYYVDDMFEWKYRGGAKKLIRGLAPSLLARRLLNKTVPNDSASTSCNGSGQELNIIKKITKQRKDFSNDAYPELLVEFVPNEVVPLRLEDFPEKPDPAAEEEEPALETENDEEIPCSQQCEQAPAIRVRKAPFYDPTIPETLWVLEDLLKRGAPAAVEAWEIRQRELLAAEAAKLEARKNKEKKASEKRNFTQKTKAKGVIDKTMAVGAMDRFVLSKSKSTIVSTTVKEAVSVSSVKISRPRNPALAPTSTNVTNQPLGFRATKVGAKESSLTKNKAETDPHNTRRPEIDDLSRFGDAIADTKSASSTAMVILDDEDPTDIDLDEPTLRLPSTPGLDDERTVLGDSSGSPPSFNDIMTDNNSSFTSAASFTISSSPINDALLYSNTMVPSDIKTKPSAKSKSPSPSRRGRPKGTTTAKSRVTKTKKTVRVRDSLPGAWACLDEDSLLGQESSPRKSSKAKDSSDGAATKIARKKKLPRVSLIDLS